MSTDETRAPEMASQPAPESAPARKQGSALRIALFVILILAIGALIFDRVSQSAAQDLYNSLEEMKTKHVTATGPNREMPSQEAVHSHIGREPAVAYDHEEMPNTLVEEYHYRGGLPWRKYIVYVYYNTQSGVRLDNVSLNQELTRENW